MVPACLSPAVRRSHIKSVDGDLTGGVQMLSNFFTDTDIPEGGCLHAEIFVISIENMSELMKCSSP